MAEAKTQPTKKSVTQFVQNIESEQKRQDAQTLITLMERITGEKAVLWGESILGFGKYHYKYESGHEGDSCLTGFSPRKTSLVVYLMPGFSEQTDLLKKLGKHKTSVGCLYLKKLSDVDLAVLEELIRTSVSAMKKKYS